MFTIDFEDKVIYKSKYRYELISIRNLSRPCAIRLAVVIVLKRQNYSRNEIKNIINEVNSEIKKLTFDFYWKKDDFDCEGGLMYERHPDVVWLYIKNQDKKYSDGCTWLARTLWVTDENDFKELEIIKPKPLGGNDKIGDIEIYWDWGVHAYNKLVDDMIVALKSKLRK